MADVGFTEAVFSGRTRPDSVSCLAVHVIRSQVTAVSGIREKYDAEKSQTCN